MSDDNGRSSVTSNVAFTNSVTNQSQYPSDLGADRVKPSGDGHFLQSRTTSQLSSAERSKVTDALIAQVGALTKANNELYAELKRLRVAVSGLSDFDREQDRRFDAFEELIEHAARRIDAIERGAAILSAWIKRPFWERVRARLGL